MTKIGIGMSCKMQDIADSIHTIPVDNGKEFAEHEYIAHEPGIDFFFAHPFAAWERGTNENMNGLVRQYSSKQRKFAPSLIVNCYSSLIV